MNRYVYTIAGRLSLRHPQRESLEILDRITEIVPPSKTPDVADALVAIQSEFPKMTDFEREFPSICFALTTGVGISYDDHADLLYELSGQLVKHLLGYLSEEDTRNVLQYHQKQLADHIHSQMQLAENRWEKAAGYKAVVSKGFTQLKENAYTANAGDEIKSFRMTLATAQNHKTFAHNCAELTPS